MNVASKDLPKDCFGISTKYCIGVSTRITGSIKKYIEILVPERPNWELEYIGNMGSLAPEIE